ncbi:MAG: hypothetical protein IPH98_07950 [Saprospiraceae bacterium]|nr:hypothetical protein [Candidatus Defluviibacterium haderslevense]
MSKNTIEGNTKAISFEFLKENRSTTLIALNKAIVDTLVCEFDFNNNNTILKQAWLNGVEIKNRYIEVTK